MEEPLVSRAQLQTRGAKARERRGEEGENESDGIDEGVEGTTIYRRRGEGFAPPPRRWGAALGAAAAPHQPPRVAALGFGAHGPASPSWSMLLLSLWAQIGPIVGAAQIN